MGRVTAGSFSSGPGCYAQQECVLTYHEILPSQSQYIYRVTNTRFHEHLSLLFTRNFLTAKDCPLPRITFDDGHRSNYEHGVPLLEQFGVKATFFVLAGRVGSTDKYLSWEQARKMVDAGHQVQSHGWSHKLLTQCTATELERELAWSKRELEDRLGIEVTSISAPGGRWDERVVTASVYAGYKYFYHSNPWTSGRVAGCIRLQGRHMVTAGMSSKHLQDILRMKGAAPRLYFRAKYRAKESARRILGDPLYHKIWCRLANYSPEEGLELEVEGHTAITDKSRRP